MLYYKPDFEEVISRYRLLSSPKACGAAIQVQGIGELADRVRLPKGRALNEWDFDRELYDYLDLGLLTQNLIWENRTDIPDDSIPCMSPYFGIAEHSAFLGGDVIMEKSTSYHIPFVKTAADVEALSFHRDSRWIHYVIDGLSYIREKGEGKVAAQLRGVCDAGDIANFIRGNDLFVDFYDDPEMVQKLFDRCEEAAAEFMRLQTEVCGSFYGLTIGGMGGYLPENSFGHLAADWSYMCSTDFFTTFGRSCFERQIAPYDNVLVHVHSGGAHVIPGFAAYDRVGYLQLSEDPKQPAPMELFHLYEKEIRSKVAVFQTTPADIEQNLEFLQDKRTILQVSVNTFAEAKRVTELVHQELPVRLAD